MRNSHFEVTVRGENWVVLEIAGCAERIAFIAASEAEADRVCREFNASVEYPIKKRE